jgi:transposase
MPTMTREELADRRKKIADAVREGKHVAEVCKKFGIGLTTVKNACREHGVKVDRKQTRMSDEKPATETLRIVAWLIQGYSGSEIAADAGVTRQYVNQVKQRATEAGIFEAVKSLDRAIPDVVSAVKLTDETKFKVLRLLLEGALRYDEIGAETGIHKATVSEIAQVAKEAGLLKFAEHNRTRKR